MTLPVAGQPGPPRGRWAALAPILALLALFLVTRPYRGIIGDALIYVTRELARSDPQGIGRDMLFSGGSQMEFTLFSPLLRLLLAHLPAASVAWGLALLALLVWFLSASWFAHALASRTGQVGVVAAKNLALVGLACLAVFPLSYAAFDVLAAAEPMAVPRPFAEAFMLCAFAAMLRGRAALTCVYVLASAAFHPLMAAGGASVLVLALALREPRWLLLPLICAGLLVAAAVADLPVARLLFQPLDAEWKGLLETRTAYLFPHLWPDAYWSRLILLAGTLAIGARLFDGILRRLCLAAIVVLGLAVALTFAFGDVWPSLLVVQAQPWRAIWFASALAPLVLGIIAIRLMQSGTSARLALCFLAMAWMAGDMPMVVAPLLALAAYLASSGDEVSERIAVYWPAVVCLCLVLFAGVLIGVPLAALVGSLTRAPADFALEWPYVWSVHPLALPVAGLAVWLALSKRAASRLDLAGAIGLLGLVLLVWDDRPAFQKALETSAPPAALEAALPPGRDEILWLGGGKEAWYWLKRPNWAAGIQGASLVFSRDLSVRWSARAESLVALRLEPSTLRAPWSGGEPREKQVTETALKSICARSDAPAAIVVPFSTGELGPPDGKVVSGLIPSFLLRMSADGLEWTRTDRVAVFSCVDARTPPR